MKTFIYLTACLVSVASAANLGGHTFGPAPVHDLILTGQSSQFREEDSQGNYRFGYDEAHATGGSGRREERHGDVVTGSYNLAVQDGRTRRVDYISDEHGFRATVITNEEGVDSSRDPADVLINKNGAAPIPVAAPLPPVAPLAPAFGAPINGPAPLPAPAPLALPIPRPLPAALVPAPAPRAIVAPEPILEAPIDLEEPRQPFSYSFGTRHSGPLGHVAPAPFPLPAPTPLALPAPAPLALPAPAPLALPAPAPLALPAPTLLALPVQARHPAPVGLRQHGIKF